MLEWWNNSIIPFTLETGFTAQTIVSGPDPEAEVFKFAYRHTTTTSASGTSNSPTTVCRWKYSG